ncbi:PhnA domain-containing protein [Enterococcus faecalis]
MKKYDELLVYDSVGKQLFSGDDVITTKDLKIQGTKVKLKRGTKLKNIRLNKGIFSIICKVKGIGEIELKTESIKKV